MDKSTLSNYGWIVIAVLVLSVMIALATPFGSYIENGVRSTTAGLFDTSEKALNVVGMSAGSGNFEDGYQGGGSGNTGTETPSEPEQLIAGATFDTDWDGVSETSFTWDELQVDENGDICCFFAPEVSNTKIGNSAFCQCLIMTSITIPSSITLIDEQALAECESLTTINFTGTKAQWNAITFGTDWNWNTPATVVHCTDGDVAI